MQNWKSKYLKMKLKYINVKPKGGANWTCSVCTYNNLQSNPQCQMCNTQRSYETSGPKCISTIDGNCDARYHRVICENHQGADCDKCGQDILYGEEMAMCNQSHTVCSMCIIQSLNDQDPPTPPYTPPTPPTPQIVRIPEDQIINQYQEEPNGTCVVCALAHIMYIFEPGYPSSFWFRDILQKATQLTEMDNSVLRTIRGIPPLDATELEEQQDEENIVKFQTYRLFTGAIKDQGMDFSDLKLLFTKSAFGPNNTRYILSNISLPYEMQEGSCLDYMRAMVSPAQPLLVAHKAGETNDSHMIVVQNIDENGDVLIIDSMSGYKTMTWNDFYTKWRTLGPEPDDYPLQFFTLTPI